MRWSGTRPPARLTCGLGTSAQGSQTHGTQSARQADSGMDVEGDGPSLLKRGEDAMMETAGRSVTVSWEDPRAAATLARGLSGLDYLTRVMKGEISEAPIGRLL